MRYTATAGKRDEARLSQIISEMRIASDKSAIEALNGRRRYFKAVQRMRLKRIL